MYYVFTLLKQFVCVSVRFPSHKNLQRFPKEAMTSYPFRDRCSLFQDGQLY